MKVGVSTLALYPQPLVDIMDRLENLQVEYCEIINEYPHQSLQRDFFDSYKLKVSIHAPLSDINLASPNEDIRNSSIAQIKKSMETASNLNADIVVVHPGHMPFLGRKIRAKILQYNLDSLRECSMFAQDTGIKMCVENMPDIEGLLYKDLNELNNLILDIDAYITLDVGHAHNMKFSVSDMLKNPRIKHIHLSDNDGSFDKHDALGDGGNKDGSGSGIDFESLFKGIKKMDYKGILVVEVEQPSAIEESLKYLKANRMY